MNCALRRLAPLFQRVDSPSRIVSLSVSLLNASAACQPCKLTFRTASRDNRAAAWQAWKKALEDGVETMRQALPQMVLWSRYWLDGNGNGTGSELKFKRRHAHALDAFRGELGTLPLPDKFWGPVMPGKDIEADKESDAKFTPDEMPEDAAKHADALYRVLLRKYTQVVACGTPMKRNLFNLASLMADPSLRVALVTGEPGTGKEFFSKALYYGQHIRQPQREERGAVFLQTTAREIQNAGKGPAGQSVKDILKGQIAASFKSKLPWAARKPKAPVLLIDELNKADDTLLAELLRPLEQGEKELDTDGSPQFILAASQHIDVLAQRPPQDFWTRISHQLRVVHPLSRVSDADAEKFLKGLFYAEWWNNLEQIIRGIEVTPDRFRERLVKACIGEVGSGEFKPSPICERMRDEFLNTLVPMVERDEVSLRAVRSMLGQMFARIYWYVRFEKPYSPTPPPPLDATYANRLARLSNAAIQEVMAILNPARLTSASMENPEAE